MVKITPEYLAKSGTEDGHQSALFCWASMAAYAQPLLRLMYAIPNGGHRHIVVATRMKATGAKTGFPDIGFPVARHECHGLFIELKRPKTPGKQAGVVSADQTYWKTKLNEQGYAVIICYGWESARDTIEAYINEGET